MKRIVMAICTAVITTMPVVANAEKSKVVGDFVYNEDGIIVKVLGPPVQGPSIKLPIPDEPFRDDAPSYEDLVREMAEKENGNSWSIENAPSIFDDSNVIEVKDNYTEDEEELPANHVHDFINREYVVVAVNPKMKRYMAKSVSPTPIKMKQNVIFTQDYVVGDITLKKGDKITLTFDENESDGIISDRKDGLVFVTPNNIEFPNHTTKLPPRVEKVMKLNNVQLWGIVNPEDYDW